MTQDQDVFELLKQRMEEHEFNPIVVSPRRLANRRYEQTEGAKMKHRKWNQSQAGKESCARRGKKYRESHPEKMREKSNRHYARHREEILARRKEKRKMMKEAKNAA